MGKSSLPFYPLINYQDSVGLVPVICRCGAGEEINPMARAGRVWQDWDGWAAGTGAEIGLMEMRAKK